MTLVLLMSTPQKFDVVILSGGGIKGIAHLGALHFYYEKKILDLEHVKEYAATSVGSVISLLLICGYTPMEIFTKVYTTSKFFKPDPSQLFKIFDTYGLMSNQSFIVIIENMVKEKFGNIPTLKELYEKTGKRFTISVVNHSKMKVEYFNHETRPNLGVVDAVKISCNLPIIFHKIKYDGDYWVDGGMADNFPYDGIINKTGKVLGVVVTGNDREDSKDTFMNYIYRLILIPINTMTNLRIKNMNENVVMIKMNFQNIPTLDFSVDSEAKMNMFLQGYYSSRKEHEKIVLYVPGFTWEEELKFEEVGGSQSSGWEEDWVTDIFDSINSEKDDEKS